MLHHVFTFLMSVWMKMLILLSSLNFFCEQNISLFFFARSAFVLSFTYFGFLLGDGYESILLFFILSDIMYHQLRAVKVRSPSLHWTFKSLLVMPFFFLRATAQILSDFNSLKSRRMCLCGKLNGRSSRAATICAANYKNYYKIADWSKENNNGFIL